jgi:hypothetical protein
MLPMRVSMTIELYEARKDVWKAREKDTGKDRPITALPECGTLQQAKKAIGAMFRESLIPWQMWGDPRNVLPEQHLHLESKYSHPRVIQSQEVEITADKVFFKIPEAVKA